MTDEAVLAERRTKMGRSVMGYVTEAHMFGAVTDGSWTCIAGSATPDFNLALVHADDPELLVEPMAQFAERGCPSLVMLAGAGKSLASSLPSTYSGAGQMPIMSADLGTVPRATDPRVRRATAADASTVTDLLAQAYGFSRDVACIAAGPLAADSTDISIYLLEQEGLPVSTVTVCREQELASVWSMATPEQHARRGYGRALLGAVLQDAHDNGATLGLLGATPAGLPLYKAVGWREEERGTCTRTRCLRSSPIEHLVRP